MPFHAITCQFQRDCTTEHLASTSVEADAQAVLFSWTDQEGRGYEVLLRASDSLVATLRFDDREQHIATQELDRHCSALGLTRRTVAILATVDASSIAGLASTLAPDQSPFTQGVQPHGH